MKVTRLPRDPGPAGWNHLLENPGPITPLNGDTLADYLVIGAGFAGLAAARKLTQLAPGARIIVLDAVRVGDGPAGRNSGFMIDLPHDLASDDYGGALDADRAQTAANRHAIGFAAGMARDFDLPEEAFAQSGKINAAASTKGHQHNLDYARHLDAMGEPYKMLDASQMRAKTGIDYYQSGLFTPGCALIQPAMFVRGVARGLAASGVMIHENTPVTALEKRDQWVAITPQGRVTAPKVVLAVNGHLASFGHYKRQLMQVFTYASMTRALTSAETAQLGGDPTWGVTPADPLGTTVRRISGQGGDRIVVRNRFTYDPSLEISQRRIDRVGRDHDRALANRFPMLAGVGMEYRWGGRLCLSRNNVQVIGELEPGVFSACCQNGLGTAKGTLAGIAAAELAVGQVSDMTAKLMQAPAPVTLPPAPLAALGANAYLRWQEYRAGRDL